MIKNTTCDKNHDNPTYIDLIITKRPDYLQHSNVFETGIFNLLIVTQLKVDLQNSYPELSHIAITKKTDNSKFLDDVNNFAFDQFDVTSRKHLIYLINKFKSNKNILEQMKPLL